MGIVVLLSLPVGLVLSIYYAIMAILETRIMNLIYHLGIDEIGYNELELIEYVWGVRLFDSNELTEEIRRRLTNKHFVLNDSYEIAKGILDPKYKRGDYSECQQ